MAKYSEKLKRTMAAKILKPGGQSALSLSGETGISQSTLSKWVREYKETSGVSLSELQRRPKDLTRMERLQALLDSANLNTTEYGIYLRKNGLTSVHLEKWKKEFISGEESPKVGRPAKSGEFKTLKRELQITKSDLKSKNLALAEMTALLVLKKKAQSIWGDLEDEK